MKKSIWIILFSTFLLVLTACTGPQEATPPEATSTPTQQPTATESPAPTPTSTPTQLSLPASDGPFLLIQTDSQTYEIIDFALNQRYPVDLPDVGRKISLGGSLSPSKTILKLPFQENRLNLFNYITGDLQTIDLPNSGFDPAQAAELALAAFENMPLTAEAALDAVQNSYNNSIVNTQWFQDDDHLLAVTTGSPTSTQLSLVDVSTGQTEALETLPGLVEKFSRSGDLVLLKKGFINEPGYYQDDKYYVLNLVTREVQAINLPADVDNPGVAWFGAATLSIIHQSQPIGGINFSTMNLESNETKTIIEGLFTSVLRYQDGLLVFRPDPNTMGSVLQQIDLSGQVLKEATLSTAGSLVTIVGDKVILNLEDSSIILDSDLQTAEFSNPIYLLSGAPDSSTWVLVNRSGQTALLDSSLGNPQPIELEGAALEVRWLPDSSAFLYRTLGKLYLFDLAEEKSTLLLESGLLGDYANINAAWITLPE
jgi:hypothetical protein